MVNGEPGLGRVLLVVLVAGVLATGPAPVAAIDHKNLDEGRPLRIEDPYAIAHGEWALEAGAGLTLQRRSPNRGLFPIELLYGAAPNLQLGLGTELSTDPHEIDGTPKSGDLHASGLWNVNQETLWMPAFGAKLILTAPTGVESRGFDVELKGLTTKSFDRLSLHLNAGYGVRTSARDDERDGRYHVALGASYPVGAPAYTRTTLIGDVFADQSVRHGDPSTVGLEAGMRHQLTAQLVWDIGIGTELDGPRDRSVFFMTTGLSYGF
jgi:hypothetical protein